MKRDLQELYNEKLTTAAEAVKLVRSGDRVSFGTNSSVAYNLMRALYDRIDELEEVVIVGSNVYKPLEIMSGKNPKVKICTYFVGIQEREALSHGNHNVDYTSFHLSQIDTWVKYVAKPTVAFVEVSLPDENGYMSYGASGVCLTQYAVDCADRVVLSVNPKAPYVLGESNLIHISQADAIVEDDEDIHMVEDMEVEGPTRMISEMLIDEIHDGDCIQLGIGGVANMVGYGLTNKNNLSCHSEMMGNSIMHLMRNGNIDNKLKKFHPGKTTCSFAMGSRALYDYLDHNEDVYFAPMPVINNPANIALNDNAVSINNALAVDLYGQVAADNLNGTQYSSIGGQVDFVRGVQMSKGGRSYIALSSTFSSKKTGKTGSKIVPCLTSPVGTSRADVQYVVTEYGCVNLKILPMRERVHAMISIAHPDFRAELTEEAKRLGMI